MLLPALVASLQRCGRHLEIYCVIKISRAISQNSMWKVIYVYAYSAGTEGAMNVQFPPSYAASVALSNDIRYSISNFPPKWYLFPERVTYSDYTGPHLYYQVMVGQF